MCGTTGDWRIKISAEISGSSQDNRRRSVSGTYTTSLCVEKSQSAPLSRQRITASFHEYFGLLAVLRKNIFSAPSGSFMSIHDWIQGQAGRSCAGTQWNIFISFGAGFHPP